MANIPTFIIEAFERVTGHKWDVLTDEQKQKLQFLPPDADISDIAFSLGDDFVATCPKFRT